MRAALGMLALASLFVLAVVDAPDANALPAFARQTGQPCGACHTAIPELRPFGRLFKLGGYQQSDGEKVTPQLASFDITAGSKIIARLSVGASGTRAVTSSTL